MRLRSALAILCLAASTTFAVSVGDKAPPLQAKTWMNGDAVNPAEPDGKTTYVVEFWATWCPPCRTTIPHLNDLHNRFKDRGVVIVGVSSEPEETVKPFAEKMSMQYRVAVDSEKTTDATWMEDVQGIPHAFIVDTNGVIVWAGHPMNRLDEALEALLAGVYSVEDFTTQKSMEEQLQALFMEGNMKDALSMVERMIAEGDGRIEYYQIKLGILAQQEDAGGVKRTYREIMDKFPESAEDLNTVAWMAVTSPFEFADLDVAWEAANRAVELSARTNSAILDTLARVHYSLGNLDKAVAAQEEALKNSPSDEETKQLQGVLDYYKSAQAVATRVAAPKKEESP